MEKKNRITNVGTEICENIKTLYIELTQRLMETEGSRPGTTQSMFIQNYSCSEIPLNYFFPLISSKLTGYSEECDVFTVNRHKYINNNDVS